MPIDPADASELANIAREVGAEVSEGKLHYPSETGSWQLGNVDLGEYLDCYRNQQLMIIFVPFGEAAAEKVTCGVCGFVMDKLHECPRCKLMVENVAREVERQAQEREQLFEDIEEYLDQGEEPEE
jgi:hypothetical protein